MFEINYKPEELFYVPDSKNFPVRRYHTSRPLQYKAASIRTPSMAIDVQSFITSDWFEEDSHNTDLPFFPQDILKLVHNFGYSMLMDDKHDIGRFSYVNRPGYPNHPSGIHHWYLGAALMAIAQIGGMIQKMKEFAEVGASMGFDLSATSEPPLMAKRIESPQSVPLFGNDPLPLPAIPYNDVYQHSHHKLSQNQYPSLPYKQIIPNNKLKSLPLLATSKQSLVPNPLKGLVNR